MKTRHWMYLKFLKNLSKPIHKGYPIKYGLYLENWIMYQWMTSSERKFYWKKLDLKVTKDRQRLSNE